MCNILIVDNELDFIKTMAGFLEGEGFSTHIATSEQEAIKAVTEQAFDFAIIDVRLHGNDDDDESGLTLAITFRKLDENVRTIVITGGRIKSQRVFKAIKEFDAIGFLEKGLDLHQRILDTIKEACKETGFPKKGSTDTHLTISLAPGQPLLLRAAGYFTGSIRTRTNLWVNLEHYARLMELARKDQENRHFQLQQTGLQLWEDIFNANEQAKELYLKAREKSEVLTISFEAPRDFIRLPVELIHPEDNSDYLGICHPMSRFIYDQYPRQAAISRPLLEKMKTLTRKELALSVLLVAANTKPAIPGADAEVKQLEKFFNQLPFNKRIKVIPSEEATYERLQTELGKTMYDIIHYAGHGYLDPISPDRSSLFFWVDQQRTATRQMYAHEIKLLLEQSKVRLVYMSCCEGIASEGEVSLLDDNFLGLADAVVRAGVPSVLGFRWPVSDHGAVHMATGFYRHLFEYGDPETALWLARREMYSSDKNDTAWLSPILIHQN